MINQVWQRQAGLQAGLQNHQRGCFCPFWSSPAPGLVQWLWVAWGHKPLCRDSRRREQPHDWLPSTSGAPGPIPGLHKLQGWRHLPPAQGHRTGYGSTCPSPPSTAMEALLPCSISRLDWGDAGSGFAVPGSPHPSSAGPGGTEPFGAPIR